MARLVTTFNALELEASTSELAELFAVTRKTITLWSKDRIVVRAGHGRYRLKESLENWVVYQRALAECADDGGRALDLFWILLDARDYQREQAERLRNIRPEDLTGLPELVPLQTIELTKDDAGNIIAACIVNDDGSRSLIEGDPEG